MNSFWRTHYDQNAASFKNSLYKQVGKTVNGIEVGRPQLEYIAKSIIDNLKLDNSDVVVDLCCGNGLITRKVADVIKTIIGVDFSDGLINTAHIESSGDNISYVVSDILHLPVTFYKQASKYYMYEGLQYFTTDSFEQFLKKMCLAENYKVAFLGGIPDKDKLWEFYDTVERKQFYQQREKDSKPHLGTWWKKDEIRCVAEKHGYKVQFIKQNQRLYTSHYRFDCLLEYRDE